MPAPSPERWIFFMLDKDATLEQTKAFAKKVDTLGKTQGFRTIDFFPGTLTIEANEAFARTIEEQFESELRGVVQSFVNLPDTPSKSRNIN